jgi:[ribosomal protein S18]-alanine N-acetyltransferase
MAPEALAALHSRCFAPPLAWSAASFAELLRTPGTVLLEEPGGAAFALVRVISDEAELLTIATHPAQRRQGLARRLVARCAELARAGGAQAMHLEVAEDNRAARTLYAACGFAESGRRPCYYRDGAGRPVAAILLRRQLLSA